MRCRLLFIAILIFADVLHAQSMQQVLPRDGDTSEYYFYEIGCSDDHNCTIPVMRYVHSAGHYEFLFERTTDGGVTWSEQESPFKPQFYFNQR